MRPAIKPPQSERERREWERAVSRRLMELEILESATIKREQKSSGVILDVKQKPGGGSGDLPVWLP
jgi:hypothetical protein